MAYHSVSGSVAILAPCTGSSRRASASNQMSPLLLADSQSAVAAESNGAGCSTSDREATLKYSRLPFLGGPTSQFFLSVLGPMKKK